MRIIHQTEDKTYRIVEHIEEYIDFENLCGDTYNPKVNTDIPEEQLKKELEQFKRKVNNEGVYGYVLERWDATPGQGYQHVDSCWGFVGSYNSDPASEDCHYIVDELKGQIK